MEASYGKSIMKQYCIIHIWKWLRTISFRWAHLWYTSLRTRLDSHQVLYNTILFGIYKGHGWWGKEYWWKLNYTDIAIVPRYHRFASYSIIVEKHRYLYKFDILENIFPLSCIIYILIVYDATYSYLIIELIIYYLFSNVLSWNRNIVLVFPMHVILPLPYQLMVIKT